MTTLLIADNNNTVLKDGTAKALTAARELGEAVHVLIAGSNARSAAETAAKLEGVEKVLLVDNPIYMHRLAEPTAALIAELAGNYRSIVAPASTDGKNILPRVSALLDVAQVSDVTRVISIDTFEHPIYAGNAIETVQTTDKKQILTIRTAAFKITVEGGAAPIEQLNIGTDPAISQFKKEEVSNSERPELTAAKVVVSGGRALGSADKFQEVIIPLADKLGAAIGASRAAVDAGYAPNDLQVGQTGKVVAPDLYVALGISGAIQHLAGMKDSKVIVAINKDEEAPIFQVADFGLVGDLFNVVPELEKALD